MLMMGQWEEISRGLPRGVIGGWQGSVEKNNSACMKGIKLNLILMKGLCKRNEPFLISPSNLIVVTENESWRIYESRFRT